MDTSPDGMSQTMAGNVVSEATGDDPKYVRLSWRQCLPKTLQDDPIEVLIDISNPLYRLYQDCISYLRKTCPPQSFTRSLPRDIRQRGLGHLSPSFGILMNLLADRQPFTDKEFAEGFPGISLDSSSMLDFLLRGMISPVGPLNTNIACDLRDLPATTTESDLYQALFLDCITELWGYESFLRSNAAVWSPMPWSRESKRELTAVQADHDDDPTAFVTPVTVLGENDLADEEDPEVHAARWRFGSPMDIRWFNARHDGYPFSPTLSSYSQIRRHGALPSVRDDAALWVSAMTLGVLEAVMHARIPESLLLIPGAHEGERVLSGTRMLRLMVNWHHHMHSHYPNWQHQSTYHADDATRLAHGQDAARILHRALNALDEEIWNAASILRRAGRDHEVTEMVCALTLLLAPLCGIAWCCWKTIPEMNTLVAAVSGAERRFVNVAIGGCAKVMHRAGWCPNTISEPFLFSFVDLSIISNLLRLPPYVRNNPGEHADCMQSACVYYTITDTKAYVPRHVEPNCQCDYIKPPLDVVLNILSEGHIPVVVYDGAELLAHSAQKRPYVAISHVWADGMGSTTEDGLPTCVVKRVASLAQNLVPESGAFWMDSLCVPAITQARKRAILLMAQTYRDAAKVLVIDACIRAQCSTSLSLQENVVRLSLSGWVRRVWTLQEGLLARELYFEFVEGPVNVAEAWSLGPSLPKDFQLHQLCRAMVPILSFRAVHGKHIDIERKAPLADIVRMLRLRSTTKPEDEIVAISSLLPLNLDAILAITGEDMAQRRMREFFLQLREVSSEFPMYPNAPRLTLPGFTWAPRTLARELAAANNMSGTGVCTEDGLLAEYFVTSLEEPIPIPTGETLGTATSGDLEFFVALRSSRSVYCLRLFITSGHAHSASIDTLLMLDGKMSDSNFTKCAGVRRGGRKEVEVEENESSTHHFSYVTPGFLDPRPGNPELFLDGKLVWVGEPHKMDVRLT